MTIRFRRGNDILAGKQPRDAINTTGVDRATKPAKCPTCKRIWLTVDGKVPKHLCEGDTK